VFSSAWHAKRIFLEIGKGIVFFKFKKNFKVLFIEFIFLKKINTNIKKKL
jgi:hypothetical protein